jgi:hypothetical protein
MFEPQFIIWTKILYLHMEGKSDIKDYIVAVSFIGGETGVPRENDRSTTSHWQTLTYNVVSSTPRNERG